MNFEIKHKGSFELKKDFCFAVADRYAPIAHSLTSNDISLYVRLCERPIAIRRRTCWYFLSETLGTGTENLDDMIVELELLENVVQLILQMELLLGWLRPLSSNVVGDLDDETSPSYECRLASDSPR